MPELRAHTRSLVLTALAVIVGAGLPAAAHADLAGQPVAQAAKKKKKKVPLTATVSGTFTIKQEIEGGFGNDSGPNFQQITVKLSETKVPFKAGYGLSAAAKGTATFTYHAEARTEDRSYHAGCDSETRQTNGTWTGKTDVVVKESSWLQTNGKSKKYAGWVVAVEPPDEIPLTSNGLYTDWDSILMTDCLKFEVNEPLGSWSSGFARPDGVGKLADDKRSVPLLSIDTAFGQTGSAKGKLRFNKAPR